MLLALLCTRAGGHQHSGSDALQRPWAITEWIQWLNAKVKKKKIKKKIPDSINIQETSEKSYMKNKQFTGNCIIITVNEQHSPLIDKSYLQDRLLEMYSSI